MFYLDIWKGYIADAAIFFVSLVLIFQKGFFEKSVSIESSESVIQPLDYKEDDLTVGDKSENPVELSALAQMIKLYQIPKGIWQSCKR